MRFAVAVGLLCACGLGGCFNAQQQTLIEGPSGHSSTSCASCRRGSGGGSASSGGSTTSAAASTTASSSTQTGSSSGSSSGGSTSTTDVGASCPDLYLASVISDAATQVPIAGATLTGYGLDGVPIAGAQVDSQADGSFALCVPSGVEFSMHVLAQGYPNTDVEDALLLKSETLGFAYGGMPLLSTNDLMVLSSLVPYNASMGAILVSVLSVSRMPPCQDTSGWQISLGFPDGGTLPDGGPLPFGRVYLGTGFIPDSTLTATLRNGDVFFYNIDPNLTDRVAILAVDTKVDAGSCPNIDSQFGLQNTAAIGSQLLTFGAVELP